VVYFPPIKLFIFQVKMAKHQMLLVSVLVVLAVEFSPVGTSSSYWGFYCTGGNFTVGSQYNRSVAAVTAILPRRAASSPLLFSSLNSSHGEATVYAVAQCQRDSPRSACHTCVMTALKDARLVCGLSDGAVVFIDGCTVGYSSYKEDLTLFPDDPTTETTMMRFDKTDVTIQGRAFEDGLSELGRAVTHRAVTSPQLFATGQKQVTTADYNVHLYALAQCSPDLIPEDCEVCLTRLLVMFSTSDEQPAGRAGNFWCTYRYGLQRFFNGSPTVTLPADTYGSGE
jgi:hypothetical protein